MSNTPTDSVNALSRPKFDHTIRSNLDLDGVLESLLALGNLHLGLDAHDATAPLATSLLVLLDVALLDGRDELGELVLVLSADLSKSEDGSGLVKKNELVHCKQYIMRMWDAPYLLVDDSAETSLALDDGIGDAHLAAESGEEDNELDGVDIVGDEDEGSLLVLNEANNVVETVLDNVGLLGDILLLLALLDGSSLLEKTLLLLGLGLGAVLVEELEGLGSGVLVENLLELGDRRRDLQAHVEDLLLALEADILRPLHHAREVARGLDSLANAEVAGALLDERVLHGNVSTPRLGRRRRDEARWGGWSCFVFAYLGRLLAASLTLGEGGRSGLLARLLRLSLRRRHQ